VPDALRQERATLRRWLGVRAADWLVERIHGRATPLVQARARAKSLSRDETFPHDLHDDAALRRELLRLADRAAGDLRSEGYRARTITVRIRDKDFTDRSAGRTLPAPVSADRPIAEVALELLAKLRAARRIPARLLGVALSQLTTDPVEIQDGLFPEDATDRMETDRDRRLSNALDRLRDRFGRDAVDRAAE
jgi:DNA polymerase-4